MRIHFLTTKHFYKVLCWLLLISNTIFSQSNLVPNSSFDQYSICPDNSTINSYKNSKPDNWYKPDIRGAAYFNRCTNKQPQDGVPYNFGGGGVNYQEPRTGDSYFAMFYYNQNGNNYIQVKLFDSLKTGKRYYCEHYVSLLNTLLKGCNNIAMLFTKNAVYVDTNSITYPYLLQANPQIVSYGNPIVTDTMGWVKISGIFTAQGGEQYLTLGNFKLASQTQYALSQPFSNPGYDGAAYYVDDVAVYALDSFCLKADAGKDTAITLGDSVFIGSYTNGIDSLKWQTQNNNTTIDSTRPGFWVHPTVTTSYILQQVVNGCFSADTVVVTVNSLPLTLLGFSAIYQPTPSPSKEGNVLLQLQTANEINVSYFNIQRSVNGRDFIAIGKVVANNKNYNEYRYTDDRLPLTVDGGLSSIYYRIESVDKDGKKQYSETRILNLKPQTLNGVSIYPNPAKEHVVITCNNAKELMIIDYLGRVVYSDKMHRESYNINLQSFSNGLYLVKLITSDNYEKVEKLIKQ